MINNDSIYPASQEAALFGFLVLGGSKQSLLRCLELMRVWLINPYFSSVNKPRDLSYSKQALDLPQMLLPRDYKIVSLITTDT